MEVHAPNDISATRFDQGVNGMVGASSSRSASGSEPDAIDEETQRRYRIFKKNTPFLYDYVCTNSLLWPSLTVQFFPDLETPHSACSDVAVSKPANSAQSQFSSQLAYQRLLLGTFTLGQAVDAIHIHQLPYYRNLNKCISTDHWSYNSDKQEFELPTVSKVKLRTLQSINHYGDVNKLRYMPQNPDILASANNEGGLFIYNRTKHSTIKKLGEETRLNEPQLRLVNVGNPSTEDIFAFDWNKQKQSAIVSASMEGLVNVHDIRGSYAARNNNCIGPSWTANHKVGINDIEWVSSHDSVFLAADDTGCVTIFDTRNDKSPQNCRVSKTPLNSLCINPVNNFCLATGDSDGSIALWDIRALHESVQTLDSHSGAITQAKWHPKFSSVLGSSSADRSVKLHDVSKASEMLLFSHEGHMLGVNDFDWSLHEDWMVASVADDNSLHVWTPSHHIVKGYRNT